MTDACQRYLEDPEANASHLAECEECRALFGELDAAADVPVRPLAVDALPLAPWEGAAHRSWPLLVGGALAVLVIALALFTLAGVSPMNGMRAAVALPRPSSLVQFISLAGSALQQAPPVLQIGVGLLFIIINALLFALLRRSPRGVDASAR